MHKHHSHHVLPRRYQYHTCATVSYLRRHRRNFTCHQLAEQLNLTVGQVQELCKRQGIRKYTDPLAPQ